jgi:hypothetical protein
VRKRLSVEKCKAIETVVLHPKPQAVQNEAPHHSMPAVQHAIAPAVSSRQPSSWPTAAHWH